MTCAIPLCNTNRMSQDVARVHTCCAWRLAASIAEFAPSVQPLEVPASTCATAQHTALSHIAPGISRLLSQEFSCTLLAVVQHHVAAPDPPAIHSGRAWLPYRLCAALYLYTLGLQATGPASFLAVRRFDSPSACWGNASGQSRVQFMDSRATRAACLSPFSMVLLSKMTCGRARLHAEGE